MEHILRLLWWYNVVHGLRKVLAWGAAIGLILLLLRTRPELVVDLLNLVAPFTRLIKKALWGFAVWDGIVPDLSEEAKQVGRWLSRQARRALSATGAKQEAYARLLLIDGLLVLSLMTWIISRVMRLLFDRVFAGWFLRHNVLLSNEEYEELVRWREPPAPTLPTRQEAPRVDQPDPHRHFDEAVEKIRRL